MTTTFAHSTTSPRATEELTSGIQSITLDPSHAEQQIMINGHALETVEPGITTKEIQAARDELMRSLSILIDLQFAIFGGIPLDLTPLHLATPEGTVVKGQNISTTELLSSFNLTNLMSENCKNLNLCTVLTSLDIAVNRVIFRELTKTLIFAFSVATILHAPNDVPDFFYEQIQQELSIESHQHNK